MQTRPASALTFNLTIRSVPIELFAEFMATVVEPHYPGGVSEALRTLMLQAILEQRERNSGLELVLR